MTKDTFKSLALSEKFRHVYVSRPRPGGITYNVEGSGNRVRILAQSHTVEAAMKAALKFARWLEEMWLEEAKEEGSRPRVSDEELELERQHKRNRHASAT